MSFRSGGGGGGGGGGFVVSSGLGLVRTVDVAAGMTSGSHVTTDLNVELVTDSAWLHEAVMLLCGGKLGLWVCGYFHEQTWT